MHRPFRLRDYQEECASACERANVLAVLPTNAGKTVIAAEVIDRTLRQEDTRKVVFLAPYGALCRQQAALLLRHIGPLEPGIGRGADPRSRARWQLGLVVGGLRDEHGAVAINEDDLSPVPWRDAFDECQVLVMTPAMLEKCLMHAHVLMSDIALLVLDEAHGLQGNSFYTTIMRCWYARATPRPRVLALTASPVSKSDSVEPTPELVRNGLAELECNVDVTAARLEPVLCH